MHNELWPAHQILTTKLRIPTLASSIVERPRLYARLDAGLHQPLTILSAPPGYGKTTLVADWLRRMNSGLPYAWVSLTQHDNTFAAFWSYIFAALDYAVPESTSQFTALLHTAQEHCSEAALIQLINTLSERATPLVLVIDNYQYITSPEVNESLAFVIEHLPEQVHVVLMTNYDPPLPLPRWRARGQVSEMHADELSCTTSEASTFFASSERHQPSGEIERIAQHTEGWFTGIRLVSVELQHASNSRSFLAEASGSYVYEYVQNEVLADQPAEVRVFLLKTSVLDEMCAELCDAVISADTAKTASGPSYHMLQKLERLNLFVVPLDDQHRRYRYHRLFREALHYLLMHEEPELHDVVAQRASAWYLSHNQLDTAIEYALRGHAWQQAATLIKQWLHEATHQRQNERVRRASVWIAQLPAEIVRDQQLTMGLQVTKRPAVLAKPSEALFAREVGAAPPIKHTASAPMPQLWNDPSAQELSPREQEVLVLIAEGASNYEIADKLVLSLHTVKRHASNILAKLNAANRTQAVAYARAYGVLSTGLAINHNVRA